MYQAQLAQLKRQKQQLKDGTHPQMVKKFKRLEQQYEDSMKLIEIRWDAEMQNIKKLHKDEIKAAKQEFEVKYYGIYIYKIIETSLHNVT